VAESSDLTPIEWLGRLGPKLFERRPQIDRWRRYYEGDQDLPQGPSQHREALELPEDATCLSASPSVDECTRWLTQLTQDRDAVRKDLVDLTVFMLATGARIGEALALTWDDVNLTAGTASIEWTLVRVKGHSLARKSTKTAAGVRLINLPTFALEMLAQRSVGPAGAPVFPDGNGNFRDPSNTSRNLRQARGSEEFAWVTSHVFRKTCATTLDDQGLTASQIADVLGHSRPSMTQDVYLGRRASDPRAALALDRILGAALNHA
jgi:integrase